MKLTSRLMFAVLLLTSRNAYAEECVPPSGGKCLNDSQWSQVKEALKELDSIKKSEVSGQFLDSIEIVHDWDGRVYVNGGDGKTGKPIRMRVTLGTIDRTLSVTLPTNVYYRERPPDPMFRFRIRAQVGILLPNVWSGNGEKSSFMDAGVGWDFFHLGPVNLDVSTGISAVGAGVGFDFTKNWGIRAGYALTYRDFRSSAILGTYFSFN